MLWNRKPRSGTRCPDSLILHGNIKWAPLNRSGPCGHIALGFAPEDAHRLTDEFMTQIAKEYMEAMGIKNTPYVIVRHTDADHPHCNLMFSRVDYDTVKAAPTAPTPTAAPQPQAPATPSLGSQSADDTNMVLGGSLSDDFAHFLKMHPGLSIEEAKRKFKEQQKLKAQQRRGSKMHH